MPQKYEFFEESPNKKQEKWMFYYKNITFAFELCENIKLFVVLDRNFDDLSAVKIIEISPQLAVAESGEQGGIFDKLSAIFFCRL